MQKAVEITNEKGLTLRGMLHVPDSLSNGETTRLVILFHGFTGHKLEGHRFFWKISKALEKHGIASVRFDFSGSGESDGEFHDVTVSGEIQDAREIIRYVSELPFVDRSNIYCLGFSLGGLVAGLVSIEKKEQMKKLALLAPAGHQMLALTETVLRQIPPDQFLFDWNANVIGRQLVSDLKTIDPYANLSNYTHPVLIIHGTKDQTVPYQVGERYKSEIGDNAELVLIEGADHSFTKKEWEDEIISRLTTFFRE